MGWSPPIAIYYCNILYNPFDIIRENAYRWLSSISGVSVHFHAFSIHILNILPCIFLLSPSWILSLYSLSTPVVLPDVAYNFCEHLYIENPPLSTVLSGLVAPSQFIMCSLHGGLAPFFFQSCLSINFFRTITLLQGKNSLVVAVPSCLCLRRECWSDHTLLTNMNNCHIHSSLVW